MYRKSFREKWRHTELMGKSLYRIWNLRHGQTIYFAIRRRIVGRSITTNANESYLRNYK